MLTSCPSKVGEMQRREERLQLPQEDRTHFRAGSWDADRRPTPAVPPSLLWKGTQPLPWTRGLKSGHCHGETQANCHPDWLLTPQLEPHSPLTLRATLGAGFCEGLAQRGAWRPSWALSLPGWGALVRLHLGENKGWKERASAWDPIPCPLPTQILEDGTLCQRHTSPGLGLPLPRVLVT